MISESVMTVPITTKYVNVCIIVIGNSGPSHLKAISQILSDSSEKNGYTDSIYFATTNHTQSVNQTQISCKFVGFANISATSSDPEIISQILYNKIKSLESEDITPIIIKGNDIHTDVYVKSIIKYYKTDHKEEKFFLSHCAIFKEFLLTDAAIMSNYTSKNIIAAVSNAVELRRKLFVDKSNIALLNAGGNTNFNTAPENWEKIGRSLINWFKLKKEAYKVDFYQFDEAISKDVYNSKRGEMIIYNHDLPNIIVPSSINEGNSIWKSMTILNKQSLSGIVVGIPMYIGLTSRTDTFESIYNTIKTLLTLLIGDEYDKLYKRN